MAHASAGKTRSAIVRADKLRGEGRLVQAEQLLRDVLARAPKSDAAWLSLAKVCAARGDGPSAEQAYEAVLKLSPNAFEAQVNLAILRAQRGALSEALALLRKALAQKPDHPLALRNYGGLLRAAGELGEAVQVLERALEKAPDDAGAHTNLGLVLSALGEHTRALVHLERAVELSPADLMLHDNLLLLMHYASGLDARRIFDAHLRYGQVAERLSGPIDPPRAASPSGRKLRLGFVTPDLRKHSVAFFVEPLLRTLDRERFEPIAYYTCAREDEVTARLKPLFAAFRSVSALDDAALAAQIRADRIDVLVDLAGHTQDNRLAVFARKPAPLAVSYLGYPNTTGLSRVDYRITDAWADPPGASEALHTEQLLRLESGFLRYEPPLASPEVSRAPSARGQRPTFGSFNALAKLSDRTLRLWSRLLAETPEAQLLLKHAFLSHPQTRAAFERRLAAHGIAPERVQLRGHTSDSHGHMAAYAEVDVALDPFPYHGATTTCDALWMGVPVVSLAGDTHVSRVGVSLLSRIGLSDLVAADEDAYVRIASALLRDTERRETLRVNLRARMAEAGLADGTQVTRAFEEALTTAYAERVRSDATDHNAPVQPAAVPLALSASESASPPDPEARWFRLSTGAFIAIPQGTAQITGYALEEQGEWFEDEIHYVRALLREGQIALDIGANHGVYALAMALCVGPSGAVCAVEPASKIAARLQASARRNGFTQLDVVQAAVSDQIGSARLQLAASSELNALGRDVAGGAFENVRLLTLDALCNERLLKNVAFVKLDVEGEELRALAGAADLIARDAPVWMVERKHGDQENHGLMETLAQSGHALFRLVPGLNVLFPHPPGTDSDPFLLNLFAVPHARVDELVARGLCARFDDAPELPDDATWREALLSTPLAGREDLARGFEIDSPGKQRHQLALCAYALARRGELSPTQRAFCLRRGLELSLAAIEDPHDLSRLMTLARLAWAWGRRAIAVEALTTALAAVQSGKARIDEPFLPPSPRYDAIDPGARLSDWAVSALLEQSEKLRAFSGYFDKKPEDALPRLKLLEKLSFQSPEMARRLALVEARLSESAR